MLKFLVIGALLWQEISCECQCTQQSAPLTADTDTPPLKFPAIDVRSIQDGNSQSTVSPNECKNCVLHETHQTIHLIGPANFLIQPQITLNGIGTSVKPAIKPGYKVSEGIGAIKVYPTPRTWNGARKTCVNDGGQLTIIRSDAEQNIIVKMLRDNSVDDAWLGLHDQFEEGDWVSVLGENIEQTGWTRWSPLIVPNPDNYNGKQHCARLLRDGNGMDDLECGAKRPFVCKISTQ